MFKKLFEEQRSYINHFFDFLDDACANKFFEACLGCKGLIVLTGVGKSGLVAEKIAATLASTGTRALYIPVTNFVHGDLGILSDQDVLIALSKSGETEELLHVIPFVKKRGATLLGLVSNPCSRLAQNATVCLCLPVQRELCPFDLVPTTSTAVQLLFGDALAVALMRAKNFTLDEYAINHPSGSIGKKLTLKVDDLMLVGDKIPACGPEDLLLDVLVELSDKRCGCLVVIDLKGHLLGIFTDGDLRRAIQKEGSAALSLSLGFIMTAHPVTVPLGMPAWDAMKLMQKDPKRWVTAAPVIHDERVVGIIRMHDLVHAGLV